MTTPIERVLPRLKEARKTPNGWDALCPAHEDHEPSLGVALGDDGTVLLKCRSRGCTAESICKAMRLSLADLFPARHRNGSRLEDRIVATYDYVDPSGKLQFQVVRLTPKAFRQRRPDPTNPVKWLWNLKGLRRVPYNLPDVQRAVGSGQVVFIVEGEKDADNLKRLGLTATTNAGGALKWRMEYAEELKGAIVVILADNDEVGQDHAELVAKSLQGLAASVKVVSLPNLPPKGDVSDWLDAGGKVEALRELVDATLEWTADEEAPAESAESGSAHDRPRILITTEEHVINELAAAALARDATIYQRGGLLVRITHDSRPPDTGIRRPNTPHIDALPPALLRDRLAANVAWRVIKRKGGEEVEAPARPPVWCVGAVHVRGDWPGVRYLEGLVEYSVLRPDGTILSTSGYDATTGLFLVPGRTRLALPDRPGKEDARSALDVLLEVVGDFPFERSVHQSAWIAALLTPLARFAFRGPAPLFLVDSNVRGAGKGLLCEIIARILTGKGFVIATYTDDQEELRKRITSLAIGGDQLVLFDNIEGNLGNGTLDAALTAPSWKDRILGVNRMAEAPLNITWYATGDNVVIAADTSRRICHVRLESPLEKPEERRDFRHPDLPGWIDAHRSELLAAALTILRAYCVAGSPVHDLTPWGSFDGWSKLVRGAVVWCGMPDPGETRIILQQQSDTTAENMALLLSCWQRMDPARRGLTVAELIRRLYKDPPVPLPDYHAPMKAAIESLVAKPEARPLGNKLRAYRRRIFNGRFIDKAGDAEQGARWVVYNAEEFRRADETQETQPA